MFASGISRRPASGQIDDTNVTQRMVSITSDPAMDDVADIHKIPEASDVLMLQ